MMKARKRTRDEVQRTLELRRSNIAVPHRNKSKYSRKEKYPQRLTTDRD